MAPTVASSGTQTATVGTEHTLVTQSSAKTCVGQVNLVNLALGETVELRVYDKTLTGDTLTPGTTLPMYFASYSHTRAEPVVQTVPIPVAYGAVFTLKQITGTGRGFDWNWMTLD